MSPARGGKLLDSDRTALAGMLDRLVPPVDGLSGAGGMGLAAEIEQRARRHRPLRSALSAVLDALSLDMATEAAGGFGGLSEEQQIATLQQIEQSIPGQFARFLQLVYTVYYMQPQVHERIGWPGGPVQPEGFKVEAFDDSVLETARQRAPLWREV